MWGAENDAKKLNEVYGSIKRKLEEMKDAHPRLDDGRAQTKQIIQKALSEPISMLPYRVHASGDALTQVTRRGLRMEFLEPQRMAEMDVKLKSILTQDGDRLCRNQIAQDYIQQLIWNKDNGNKLIWIAKRELRIYAFAICTEKGNQLEILHLDLICGWDQAGALLQMVMMYAKKYAKRFFELEAVNKKVLDIYQDKLKTVFNKEAYFRLGLSDSNPNLFDYHLHSWDDGTNIRKDQESFLIQAFSLHQKEKEDVKTELDS